MSKHEIEEAITRIAEGASPNLRAIAEALDPNEQVWLIPNIGGEPIYKGSYRDTVAFLEQTGWETHQGGGKYGSTFYYMPGRRSDLYKIVLAPNYSIGDVISVYSDYTAIPGIIARIDSISGPNLDYVATTSSGDVTRTHDLKVSGLATRTEIEGRLAYLEQKLADKPRGRTLTSIEDEIATLQRWLSYVGG